MEGRPGESTTLRLFVAIYPPSKVASCIVGFQKRLRNLIPEAWVRWIEPDQIHLTLKFLGRVRSDQLPKIQETLEEVCCQAEAFEVRAEGVGCFPGSRRPSIIWIGMAESGKDFSLLKTRLDSGLSFIEADDKKPFRPHMTIGRVKTDRLSELTKLSSVLKKTNLEKTDKWLVKEVHLVESHVSSNGATHHTLQKFQLQNR
jgi:RNA 2',3'-cyclic 3'-phosphodiesterase